MYYMYVYRTGTYRAHIYICGACFVCASLASSNRWSLLCGNRTHRSLVVVEFDSPALAAMPVPGEKKGKFKSANLNARTRAPERKDKDQRYGGGRLMVLGKGRAPRPGEARTSAHAGPVNTKSLRSEGSSQSSTPSLVPATGSVRKDEHNGSKPESETGFTAEDLEPKYVDNHQFAPTVAPWAKEGVSASGGSNGSSGGVAGGTGR